MQGVSTAVGYRILELRSQRISNPECISDSFLPARLMKAILDIVIFINHHSKAVKHIHGCLKNIYSSLPRSKRSISRQFPSKTAAPVAIHRIKKIYTLLVRKE
jgi:hypothetical protein